MLGTLLKWFGGEGGKKGRGGNGSDSLPSLSKLYEGDRGIHDLHFNSAVLRILLPVSVVLTVRPDRPVVAHR